MNIRWKVCSIILLFAVADVYAIVIRQSLSPKGLKLTEFNELRENAILSRNLLNSGKYIHHKTQKHCRQLKHSKRHLDEAYSTHRMNLSVSHTLHLADFFIVIVAVFIGALIASFVSNIFNRKQASVDPSVYSYRAPPPGYRAFGRKLYNQDSGRELSTIKRQIHKGEGKLATYVNRVLFNSHNVNIPKNKLFRDLKNIKRYFDDTGFKLPDKLTERKLYLITKNVFWNLHHFNMEKKHRVAFKAIHTLYSHRKTLFNTFLDSIKGV